jgi:hypothetical protein
MKIGKNIPLMNCGNVKLDYGTIDSKNLKSLYLNFESWIEPSEDDDYDKIIQRTRKNIKNYIYNFKNDFFKKLCIVDLEIKSNSLKTGKRSFMKLEITLYVNDYFDIKSTEIKDLIEKLMCEIIENCLTDTSLFNFYLTKKSD